MSERPGVDAVIVAYNSAATLRDCVAPLVEIEGLHVTIVDNASPDDTEAAVAGLRVDILHSGVNGGFAAGCNLGVANGSAPYVLLLNPDARIDAGGVAALVAALESDPCRGLAGPRILEDDGSLAYSQRRFPRRRSTFAQALFLHRLWPNAAWTDELIRDAAAYDVPGSPEWVSGACMLVRRDVLERIGGLDERFFLYCEDIDLCARVRAAECGIAYVPDAVARHEGGVSAPREELLAVYARNRVRYARKHGSPVSAVLEGAGVALGHATHALTSIARPAVLRGHLRALAAVFRTPALLAHRAQEVR